MFSILITAYNASNTINQTMESIWNQTYKVFEVIIVNDGSTDNTLMILEEWKQRFDEIYIYSPGKLGRGNALNFGASKAKFNWIAIIDADDLWHPQKLEIFKNAIERFPNTAVFCSKLLTFNKKKPSLKTTDSNTFSCWTIPFKSLVGYNYVCHSSAVVKKTEVIYRAERKTQIDYELWLRIAEAGKTIRLIQVKLAFHRQHAHQNFEGKKNFNYRLNAIKLTQTFALRNGFYFTYLWLPVFYFLGWIKQLIVYRINSK
jgi:glycosyltransferase involved in cell wall biosynthesis